MRPTDLVPLITPLLPPAGRILTADARVASALRSAMPGAQVGPDDEIGLDPVDAVCLLSGEVAQAGERGPTIIDRAVRRTRPGGALAVAAASTTFQTLTGATVPSLTSDQLHHMLTERGLEVRLRSAPGAAARLAGRDRAGAADAALDGVPGLLDAGPVVLAVATTAPTPADRSRQFFASITRRIVAASVLCRDGSGSLLVVFDRFKGAWTLPGGLVDAGESPVEAAVREAHEEGGVDVQAGALLGVFAHPMPDRVHLVYDATPVRPTPSPVAVHDHEIAEVRWVPPAEALTLLDPDVARKVRLCQEQPGGTHRW